MIIGSYPIVPSLPAYLGAAAVTPCACASPALCGARPRTNQHSCSSAASYARVRQSRRDHHGRRWAAQRAFTDDLFLPDDEDDADDETRSCAADQDEHHLHLHHHHSRPRSLAPARLTPDTPRRSHQSHVARAAASASTSFTPTVHIPSPSHPHHQRRHCRYVAAAQHRVHFPLPVAAAYTHHAGAPSLPPERPSTHTVSRPSTR